MQSCSITQNDQELILKTNLPKKKIDDGNKEEVKKFLNQRHYGNFPIFVYNCGLRKMIIQNNLGNEAHNYVLELPAEESFVDFVEWNKFEDFGFDPLNLKIEASSFIVFLTMVKAKRQKE
jgi:hypothetical protein